MIREIDARMLELLADVLHGNTPKKITEDEWRELFAELSVHRITSLPSDHIQALGLSESDETEYTRSVIMDRRSFHRVMKEQKKLISVLDAAGIPSVVLKGAASAVNYPDPESRNMGDIDILVLPEDYDKAYDALLGAGCTMPENFKSEYRHADMITKNGVVVELHRFFSSSDDEEQNKVFDGILYHAIPRRTNADICGYSFPMLPPLENGLVLLGHINHHLSFGLGLRQIIDWMTFAERYLDDATWENGFAYMADKIGMKRLAVITTAMCRKYLGMTGDIHWCEYEPVCDELMEYVLSCGNFGRKENDLDHRISFILLKFRNPVRGLKTAQERGLSNWEAAEKHRLLRPFAWCYQLCVWAKKGIKGGATASVIREANASAGENAELMKKLGVTRI